MCNNGFGGGSCNCGCNNNCGGCNCGCGCNPCNPAPCC